MYTLSSFNQLPIETAKKELFNCCGSITWVNKLINCFPFKNETMLFEQVSDIWYNEVDQADYLEAFTHHPKIGDMESPKKESVSTIDWAAAEQAGVNSAKKQTLIELADYNEKYYLKFGYIYIVCATGKSASKMLHLLKERMKHQPDEELAIAAGEQHKITLIRLKELLQFQKSIWNKVSQITSHVLDTSIGIPGEGICIKLKKEYTDSWQTVSLGITDEDGRITDMLPAGITLPIGYYRMEFQVAHYFSAQHKKSFYFKIVIDFNTFDQGHYHVPLLLNPYGYSTYRGS